MTSVSSHLDLSKFQRPVRKQPKVKTKIMHFGPGAFFRSFVGLLIDEVNKKSIEKWGVIAVSLNSDNEYKKLVGQEFLFNALEINQFKKNVRQISLINECLVASKNRGAVLSALSDQNIEVVSLTITEKGYCYSSKTKELDYSNQKIIEDLNNIDNPQTAIGFIVAGLRERYLNGKRPFTILSCDNLPNNGALVKKLIFDFAQKIDPTFANWVSKKVCFPSSMVDRITPATKDQDIVDFAKDYGLYDPALVIHEEFFQWVIEDNFSSVRPEFELAGIQMVKNVELHEKMKLRCLNGTHSAIAYLGYLAGFETVAECVTDKVMANYIQYLWNKEITPTLETPEGENLNGYCKQLLERFKNPSIEHRTWQIAMDGSQKLPQRFLETITYLLKNELSFQGLALAIAAWIKYVSGIDLNGDIIDVRDPLADDFATIFKNSKTSEQYVNGILNLREIFPAHLADNSVFRTEIHIAYNSLEKLKSTGAIKKLSNREKY